jgi:hypothetical protein
MKHGRFMILAVLLIILGGCASATPPTLVTSIDPLVGKWKGRVNIGRSVDFIYLTIEPDRTLIATWADISARGTVTISGGQATYQMSPPPQEGTLKLYTDNGKRQLYMENLNGAFSAVVEPGS